jgi:hypothetical protein
MNHSDYGNVKVEGQMTSRNKTVVKYRTFKVIWEDGQEKEIVAVTSKEATREARKQHKDIELTSNISEVIDITSKPDVSGYITEETAIEDINSMLGL